MSEAPETAPSSEADPPSDEPQPRDGHPAEAPAFQSAQNEVGKLSKLVLKRPAQAWGDTATIAARWQALQYRSEPDLEGANAEYEAFAAFFEDRDVEIEWLPSTPDTGLDSIYVRDAAVVTDGGVVLCNMGKRSRLDEPDAQAAYYSAAGIPVLGAITGDGMLEGGDLLWLGPRTVAIGLGYRTNPEGARQFGALARDHLDELIVVPLPHWKGPDDVFHLMSMLSLVDTDLALVFSPLLPVPFRELLIARGIRLVETPPHEFEILGANVLALAPREVLMVDAQPGTRANLEAAGVTCHTFKGDEICLKGCGGPTCLTRPLERAPV